MEVKNVATTNLTNCKKTVMVGPMDSLASTLALSCWNIFDYLEMFLPVVYIYAITSTK